MATALDYAHMKECVARTTGELDEAKAFVRVVPFDDGLDPRPEGISNWGPRGGAYPKLREGGW